MKLAFRELGTSGEAFIVMHGLLGGSDNWLTLSREWASDYRMFLLDLRNHGRSPHDNEHNYHAMAFDINEFMQDHDLRRAIVLGHSMGGKVAMNLALNYPQKVSKLIVADIAPKPYRDPEFIHIIEKLISVDLATITNRREADAAFEAVIEDRTLRGFLLKNLDRKGGKFYWRVNLQTLQNQIDRITEDIADDLFYEGETLFLRGETSGYVCDKDFPVIRKRFPNAVIETIIHAGHWVHVDQPELVIAKVKAFLKPAVSGGLF